MNLTDKLTISASMLLTGFAIVFGVLIFLIFLIWLYGRIVTSAQAKVGKAKAEKAKKKSQKEAAQARKTAPKAAPAAPAPVPVQESGVTDEIVAVISAAVYSMYGSGEKVRIKSIKKARARSAWANAGVLDNTRPF